MVQTEKQPVAFFENLSAIEKALSNKEVFLFLDYDGTLTPIVSSPEKAILSLEMRERVVAATKHLTVAIVSGRATDDVRLKVNIDNIFYAGSHGFEIVFPDGSIKINQEAQAMQPVIDSVFDALKKNLSHIHGALVEHVKYTISAHYRLVAQKDLEEFKGIVEKVLQNKNCLRMNSGKKVFEIRPDIDWDKGKAVRWIMKSLNFQRDKHIAFYIGDDTTDEDAFEVMQEGGVGVLVSDVKKQSKAQYCIKDPSEVLVLLDYLNKEKR